MTTVFIYKGIIGISSQETCESLIAKPGNGNLGCVCDASKMKISKEALEALKTIPKGKDSIGDIDIFQTNDKKVIFSWFGGYLKAFKPNKIETSRDYNPDLLTHSDDVEIPQKFIDYVNKL